MRAIPGYEKGFRMYHLVASTEEAVRGMGILKKAVVLWD